MDIVVVEFEGGIDKFPRLIQTVDGLIADGEKRVVLDLATLAFINSAALGYLIKTQQNLQDQGGKLALVRVQPAIRNILTVTSLSAMFPHFDTVEKAVEHLGGDAKSGANRDAKPLTVKRKPLASKG